jgi:hypothetical protein
MGKAFEFITNKEVVVAPWSKKPDVELLDPSGELLTIYLDITTPALHQEAITKRTGVYKNARNEKQRWYPRKDNDGRLLTEYSCIPFILTSMGGLNDEGVEFLRMLNKRNPEQAKHLQDVLVSQHARWTARRVRRALFGQALPRQAEDAWRVVSSSKQKPRVKACADTRGDMRALRQAFSTHGASDTISSGDTPFSTQCSSDTIRSSGDTSKFSDAGTAPAGESSSTPPAIQAEFSLSSDKMEESIDYDVDFSSATMQA